MQWLAVSLVVSVVLTVVLNIVLRAFPNATERLMNDLADRARPSSDEEPHGRVRVFAPWKAMLLGSLALTLVLNLVLWSR